MKESLISIPKWSDFNAKAHGNFGEQQHTFQSQNGLILTGFWVITSKYDIEISIPKWSDFNKQSLSQR